MADKLDYTIQIDGDQYDVTAADSLHADLANQVENALIVKESVRKSKNYKAPNSDVELKDIESLAIGDLQADIADPNTNIGVVDSRDTRDSENNGHSFAYKGDFDTTLEVVPSSVGLFTGPIYAPDIDAGDGFNINKFQVTNYNSVDTIIRELKGFPVYEWTGTQVRALTEGNPPTMLPFKVIIYTGSESDGWANREKLRLINSMPDGTKPFCDTECKFFLINATNDSVDGGRILLGTYTPNGSPLCTYEELRVAEADHANKATNADTLDTTDGKGSVTQPIYLAKGTDGGVATACYERAGGTAVTLNGDKKFIETATDKTETAASFYAPTAEGETNQVLLSAGKGKAPTWANQNTLSVKEAQDVTTSIDGMPLATIFVHTDKDEDEEFDSGELEPKVQNAAHADNASDADNVTNKIGKKPLTEIFVYEDYDNDAETLTQITTKVQRAAISDKLHIHELGGGGTTELPYKPGTTETTGNYIIYGSVDPDNFKKNGTQCTDEFKRTGNIYIKI